MKTRILRLIILFPLLITANSGRCAERFAGRFAGEGLTIEAQGDQSNYTGTITQGEDAFKFTASGQEDGFAGSFNTPDGQFDFRCVIHGDTLTLTSGNTRYELARVNPLAKRKISNGSGTNFTSFVRQHGKGFLGQFARSLASNKGHLSESATAAGLGTLASIGQTFGAVPPQNPSAASLPSGALPANEAEARPVNDLGANSLPGVWIKTEQTFLNGVASISSTYAVFRSDGAMLLTMNPQSAHHFYRDEPTAGTQPAGASQTADDNLHARWASKNSILTMTYNGGGTAEYVYEVRPSPVGSPVLRIQGGDGAPVQEWTKSY